MGPRSATPRPRRPPPPAGPVLDLGVPSLGDDAGELGGAARVHLQPVRAAVILCTPRTVKEIVLVGTRLGTARGHGWGEEGTGMGMGMEMGWGGDGGGDGNAVMMGWSEMKWEWG